MEGLNTRGEKNIRVNIFYSELENVLQALNCPFWIAASDGSSAFRKQLHALGKIDTLFHSIINYKINIINIITENSVASYTWNFLISEDCKLPPLIISHCFS